MTTTQPLDPLDKKAIEIMNTVDQVRRMLLDYKVEEKRLVLVELDRWISLEESTHAIAAGQQH